LIMYMLLLFVEAFSLLIMRLGLSEWRSGKIDVRN
jgi:hypothetical protein